MCYMFQVSTDLVNSHKTVRFCCVSVLASLPYCLTSLIVTSLGLSPSFCDSITMTSLVCFVASTCRPLYVLSADNLLRRLALTVCCGTKPGRLAVGPETVTVEQLNERGPRSRPGATATGVAIARTVHVNSAPNSSTGIDFIHCTRSSTLHLTPIEEQSRTALTSPHRQVTKNHSDGNQQYSDCRSEYCSWPATHYASHLATWRPTSETNHANGSMASTDVFGNHDNTELYSSSSGVTTSPRQLPSPYKSEKFFGEKLCDADEIGELPTNQIHGATDGIGPAGARDCSSNAALLVSCHGLCQVASQHTPGDLRQLPYVV